MITKMLEVSTGNLSEETAKRIDAKEDLGLVVYNKGEYGWFIFVPYFTELEAEDVDKIPQDLLLVLAYAKANQCNWVMFDRDVDPIHALPVYEW